MADNPHIDTYEAKKELSETPAMQELNKLIVACIEFQRSDSRLSGNISYESAALLFGEEHAEEVSSNPELWYEAFIDAVCARLAVSLGLALQFDTVEELQAYLQGLRHRIKKGVLIDLYKDIADSIHGKINPKEIQQADTPPPEGSAPKGSDNQQGGNPQERGESGEGKPTGRKRKPATKEQMQAYHLYKNLPMNYDEIAKEMKKQTDQKCSFNPYVFAVKAECCGSSAYDYEITDSYHNSDPAEILSCGDNRIIFVCSNQEEFNQLLWEAIAEGRLKEKTINKLEKYEHDYADIIEESITACDSRDKAEVMAVEQFAEYLKEYPQAINENSCHFEVAVDAIKRAGITLKNTPDKDACESTEEIEDTLESLDIEHIQAAIKEHPQGIEAAIGAVYKKDMSDGTTMYYIHW